MPETFVKNVQQYRSLYETVDEVEYVPRVEVREVVPEVEYRAKYEDVDESQYRVRSDIVNDIE